MQCPFKDFTFVVHVGGNVKTRANEAGADGLWFFTQGTATRETVTVLLGVLREPTRAVCSPAKRTSPSTSMAPSSRTVPHGVGSFQAGDPSQSILLGSHGAHKVDRQKPQKDSHRLKQSRPSITSAQSESLKTFKKS